MLTGFCANLLPCIEQSADWMHKFSIACSHAIWLHIGLCSSQDQDCAAIILNFATMPICTLSGCAAPHVWLDPCTALTAKIKRTCDSSTALSAVCSSAGTDDTAYYKLGQSLHWTARQAGGLQTCLSRHEGACDLRLQVVGEVLFGQACLQAEFHPSCDARHLQKVAVQFTSPYNSNRTAALCHRPKTKFNMLGEHLLTEATQLHGLPAAHVAAAAEQRPAAP